MGKPESIQLEPVDTEAGSETSREGIYQVACEAFGVRLGLSPQLQLSPPAFPGAEFLDVLLAALLYQLDRKETN